MLAYQQHVAYGLQNPPDTTLSIHSLRKSGWFTTIRLGLILAAPATFAGDITGPSGIYLMGQLNSLVPYQQATANPSVDFLSGYNYMASWEALEPEAGVYNFDGIKTALDAVYQNGHSLTLTPIPTLAPQHVIDLAESTWNKVDRQFINGEPVLVETPTATPWDTNTLASWGQLLQAMSQEKVSYTDTNGATHEVALADHPALETVHTVIPGIGGIRDLSAKNNQLGDLVQATDYNRDTFIQSVVDSVRTSRAAFSGQFSSVAFFRLNDAEGLQGAPNDISNDLDYALFQALQETFNGEGQPSLGYFQENLTDIGPLPEVNGKPGLGYFLGEAAPDTYIMLQATSAWTGHEGSGDNRSSGTPLTGIQLGLDLYGAVYYEIYRDDVLNPDLQNDWRTAQNLLQTATVPLPPALPMFAAGLISLIARRK